MNRNTTTAAALPALYLTPAICSHAPVEPTTLIDKMTNKWK